MAVTISPNTILTVRDYKKTGDNTVQVVHHETEGSITLLEIRNGIEQPNVQLELEAIRGKLGTLEGQDWMDLVGAVSADSEIPKTGYKKKQWWLVKKEGTYRGQVCEPGDFVVCIENYTNTYSDAHFTVVQNNIQAGMMGKWVDYTTTTALGTYDISKLNEGGLLLATIT